MPELFRPGVGKCWAPLTGNGAPGTNTIPRQKEVEKKRLACTAPECFFSKKKEEGGLIQRGLSIKSEICLDFLPSREEGGGVGLIALLNRLLFS